VATFCILFLPFVRCQRLNSREIEGGVVFMSEGRSASGKIYLGERKESR